MWSGRKTKTKFTQPRARFLTIPVERRGLETGLNNAISRMKPLEWDDMREAAAAPLSFSSHAVFGLCVNHSKNGLPSKPFLPFAFAPHIFYNSRLAWRAEEEGRGERERENGGKFCANIWELLALLSLSSPFRTSLSLSLSLSFSDYNFNWHPGKPGKQSNYSSDSSLVSTYLS